MNPMIGKELRQRMREKRGWILPSLYLLVLGGVVAFAYFITVSEAQQAGPGRELQGAQIGIAVFGTVTYAQMALLLLLAPVFSAGALTIEKEQHTLPGLLTSLLTVWQIWWGKFVSSMLFLLLLLISSLPVLSLAFALGGVGPRQVGLAAASSVLVLACISAIGLYCSSYFRRSVHSTAVTYGVVIAITVLTFVGFLISMAYWENARRSVPDAAVATGALPTHVIAPLYLNPFFLVTVVFVSPHDWYPDWVWSAVAFLALTILAVILALRNIRRSGTQV
jgi:ABC-type transport system involved in multi-copper enzyme maturation permease subunit